MCRSALHVRALCVAICLMIDTALVISINASDATHPTAQTPTRGSTTGAGDASPRHTSPLIRSATTAGLLVVSPLPNASTMLSLTAEISRCFGIEVTGEAAASGATAPRQRARKADSAILISCKGLQGRVSPTGDRGMGVSNVSGPPASTTAWPGLFVHWQVLNSPSVGQSHG
jgi:hypothetical protein